MFQLYMKFIPLRILDLIENKNNNNVNNEEEEEIIFNNNTFLVVKDIKHTNSSYHYTAWIKKDIRSLIEINQDIINSIQEIQSHLLEKSIITKTHTAFVHFPPQFWRLHVHFVQDNHIFEAPEHEIIKVDDIIQYYKKDENYFIKNIRLLQPPENKGSDIKNCININQEWLY